MNLAAVFEISWDLLRLVLLGERGVHGSNIIGLKLMHELLFFSPWQMKMT